MNNIVRTAQIIEPVIYNNITITQLVFQEITAPPFCNKCKKFVTDQNCKSNVKVDSCSLPFLNNYSVLKKNI
jgi:hypothetical protein